MQQGTQPPPGANAKSIVAKYREQVAGLYAFTQGRLDALHEMFCQIAEHNGKLPLQPATTLAVFDLTPEDCKAQPVIVSEVALVRPWKGWSNQTTTRKTSTKKSSR